MDFYGAEDNNLLRRVINWIVDIVLAVAIAWFAIYSFGAQVRITGNSMLPKLQSDDVVLVNRLIYDFTEPKRWDVAVFTREDGKANVKRIVGLPGETVQIKNGQVYIDDKLLEAPEDMAGSIALAGLAENPVHLGEDEYFLLGDNRDSSEDSRFANVGNVTKEQITGKVWFRLYPMIDAGWIH